MSQRMSHAVAINLLLMMHFNSLPLFVCNSLRGKNLRLQSILILTMQKGTPRKSFLDNKAHTYMRMLVNQSSLS
ncbi:hypothetical protein T05_2021 [Trichinella murrelli]|uniref:Uncharacterized protein n=1 Tax=Trichinella murrelli TaxID=144512 RepID=A0A0V0TSF1_9BILA|nr:hypothetical protein T05_2021 [Trichinella murrelli]